MARGIAIVVMVCNHLTAGSYLNAVTQGRIYTSAAEAFVVLSGFVLGIVSARRADRAGVADAMKRLVARAKTLYLTYVVLGAVAVTVTLVRPGAVFPIFGELSSASWKALVAVPFFGVSPRLLDVLQLYAGLIIASPLLLYALRRGWTLPVVALSFGMWANHQAHPHALGLPTLVREHSFFAFTAWQLVYVVGFTLGYHRAAVSARIARVPRWLLGALCVTVTALAVALNHLDVHRGTWPDTVPGRAVWSAATDRGGVGAVRIVTSAAFFTLIFLGIDRLSGRLSQPWARPIVEMGQSSLYVFLVHLPVVVLWHRLGGPQAGPLYSTVGQVLVLALLWAMVRQRFMFGLVPR